MRRVAVTYRSENKAAPYFAALRAEGAEPVGVTPENPLACLDEVLGLMLCGGSDLNPRLYGQVPNGSREIDNDRDALELPLLLRILRRDLPVLAICRGAQLFNVAHGGTLHQHMTGHTKDECPRHSVELDPGSKLAAILGPGPHEVNSRHHQAADQVGEGLVVAARAFDGVIEALERPDRRFAIAVQWHPEDITHWEPQRRLFRAFVDAL
jgi:putative glutamine amidotransferase